MIVQIGDFGTIEIGHKTKMGKVSQVIDMGNKNRVAKGLSKIEMKSILRRQDLWEFVIARNTQQIKLSKKVDSTGFSKCADSTPLEKINNSYNLFPELNSSTIQSDYSEILYYKGSDGKIRYEELMKKFPTLIKSSRGKKGGTFAELYILLKIASILDKDLEVEIYRIFIEENLLFFRDLGGDNFKLLNIAIDTLSDRKGKNNKGVYRIIATLFRDKLEILETKGYNEKEHNSFIQLTRSKWLDRIIFAIESNYIKTYQELKVAVSKLK